VSRLVRVRVSCLREKRDSFGAFLTASGDGANWDSGLYMGDVYVDEPGLSAAGVGGKGKSSMDEPNESSARLMIPACAAIQRALECHLCDCQYTVDLTRTTGHKPLAESTASFSPTEAETARSSRAPSKA
jgi:hypothetical protein